MRRSREQLKGQILYAAQKRFMGPGYSKTTMTEIAEDCDLSPAHLYNFYKSKLDLAVAISDEQTQMQCRELATILSAGTRAEETLLRYFKAELEMNFKLQSEFPGMPGLLELVRKKRKVAAEGFRIRFLKDLSLFLNSAMQRGELEKRDPFWLAEILHAATFPYRGLSFPLDRELDELLLELEGVVELLLNGMRSR